MNKKQKVYYANLGNMGDQLNKLIIEKLFGYPVVRHTYLTGNISGIGSGLGQFTLHGNMIMRCAERFFGMLFPNVTIWGSGFYRYQKKDFKFYRRNTKFAAVRGELSKQRVEAVLGHHISAVTADAGILAPYLFDDPIEKKYKVGIIPHMNELTGRDWEFLEKVRDHYDNSIIINVTDDPLQVVRQIAECEVIISSSLHGLIVADGFHIPNRHIIVTEKLGGDGFKFDDYYSAYGLEHKFTDLRKEELPSVEQVIGWYAVSADVVEMKKQQLIECFPGMRKNK